MGPSISAPLLLVLLSLGMAVSGQDIFAYSKQNCVMNTTLPYRLPLSVIPSHYHLDIWPGLDAPYALNGTVTVDVDVVMDTTCIVLHQHQLLLHDVFLSSGSNATISPIFVEVDDEKQFAILYFEDMIEQGSAQLSYQYDGYANTDAGGGKGFFVSILELVPPGNSKMFATQFEGPYARSAYPCFDEPSLKATFSSRFVVTLPSYIDSLDDLTVLFNTKEEKITTNTQTGQKEFIFERTPVPISSYLVAFAIGEFSFLEMNSNDIRYRIYCSPGKEQYAAFSLNITVELIEFWAGTLNVPYPFNKLDQIAVPKIIEDGMENMGLVTYWPPWLLENGNYSTKGQEQQAAQVIAHELVHMWFGDMVTLPWWSETYNNEGFARYLQYVGCQYLYPDWDVWESGSSSYFSFAYNYIVTDSLGVGRSLVVPPGTVSGTVDSVTNMFSGPTYPKGAAVNRMMNYVMGDDDWYNGLGYHVQKNLYGNPTSQQILRDLDEYTNNEYSMTENFMPWLTYTAFPVITATLDGNTLTLTQTPVSPFMPKYDEAMWFVSVPVTFESSGTTEVLQFSTSSATFSVSESGTFIANPMHTGYFVVNYGADNWASVMEVAAASSYDPVQRKLLAQDVFILGRMAHVAVDIPSSLLAAFDAVLDFDLWSLMLPRYYQVGIALQKQTYYSSAVEEPAVAALGPLVDYFESSSNTTDEFLQFESLILFWDVFYGDEATANQLVSLFESGSQISAGQLDATYWAAGFYGSSADYNQLTSIYSSAAVGSSQLAAAVLGLSATQDTNLCQQSLSLFGGDSRLGASDKLVNGGQMMRYNHACRGLAWEFVKKEGEVLFHQEGSGAADTVLDVISGIFTSTGEFQDLQRYLALNSAYLTQEQIHSTLVQVEINMGIVAVNDSN